MVAADNRRDLEASISFLAPNAVVQREASPAITGTTVIRTMFEESFKSPFKEFLWETRTIVLATKGEFAYELQLSR